MVTSIKNLKNQIDSRLAGGGLDALACCQLQNSQTILNDNIVYSVPNLASLPSAALNEGRLVYVDDINEYRIANDISWTDDVSSGICAYNFNLFSWGYNLNGALGDGTLTNRCSPVRERCSATDWCQVSAGPKRVASIKSSGQLWVWGCNTNAALGNGTQTNSCSPVREFCSATDWRQVSTSGTFHTAAIKTSGELWTWGYNGCGRLGDGTVTTRCSPIRERCSATDWCQVSVGGNTSSAIKTSGQLWSWGAGSFGQLGDGTSVAKCSPVRERCSATDWCQTSVGFSHTAAIKTTGQIWTWGYNRYGRLGNGTTINLSSPVREISSSTDWCQVSAGCHTIAIKTSGELWAWGLNNCGQLGDGTTVAKCSPVREFCSATDWCQLSAGDAHSSAVKTSGQIWAWGNNGCGRLGDGTTVNKCSPVRERCSATDWCGVSAGGINTSAIRAITKGFLE
jgi:alpha-tubulin suppressor-like RCC1 family protein